MKGVNSHLLTADTLPVTVVTAEHAKQISQCRVCATNVCSAHGIRKGLRMYCSPDHASHHDLLCADCDKDIKSQVVDVTRLAEQREYEETYRREFLRNGKVYRCNCCEEILCCRCVSFIPELSEYEIKYAKSLELSPNAGLVHT
jgi:hypothetical protein